jgi:hypothetical protein
MRHLSHFLRNYDKYLVVPAGTTVHRAGFRTIRFPRRFFGSAAANNRLLMWRPFYRAFEEYDYILMYHLDALVLSDQLAQWCQAGWDYIGAPWVPCSDTPWVKEARVGNGGFALMRVRSVLEVLSNRHRQEPASYWSDLLLMHGRGLMWLLRLLARVQRFAPESGIIERALHDWRVDANPAVHGRNNDFFWSFEATTYLRTFKVASVEEGLRFAFEAAPRMCFELNQRHLPFGCHAWHKFDRGFWEPHLLAVDASTR